MNLDAVANNRVSKGKPPTRLQKQAPATLHLHQIPNNQPHDTQKTVIPLLSPLVLPPPSFPEASHHEIAIGKIPPVQQTSGGGGSRWQHPAMSVTVADSSSLYTCFMSQCSILPRNQ
ncbi:hypothetical protein L1987_22336 [Smallanthus sonchifolius]|uniref:Uncharacterized protein n=1 Tax=Smallanthus sonchifolius TaxID=185202 RepID=A0ACB9IG13_9ASTR|nr:hypothetical protein L1987_22336 [Smallanthus sonchifolius]